MKRAFVLLLFLVLVITGIVITSQSFTSSIEPANTAVISTENTPSIPSEKGVFQRAEFAKDYAQTRIDPKLERRLESYYKNRAFHGAPPIIPHPVEDERNMGEISCLQCHENGGYVAKFDAFAPVVPHPEKVNCRQCHVPVKTDGLFQATNWDRDINIPIHNNALPGSPPIIPHQLQLHENCLSCHAGPSAPKEIRVSHPERINCRQCHVVNNKETKDIGEFKR